MDLAHADPNIFNTDLLAFLLLPESLDRTRGNATTKGPRKRKK